jgi:hypothetical protein
VSVTAAVSALVTSVALYLLFRRLPEAERYHPHLSGYPLGKDATVLEVGDSPRVRVAGETWRARLAVERPAVGDTLRVMDGDGNTLICAAPDAEPRHAEATGPRAGLLGEMGRVVALVLAVVVAALAVVALMFAPVRAAVSVFGFLAPLSVLLGLIALGSGEAGAGYTVRRLRGLMAATCGLAVFLGLAHGPIAAIGSALSAFVLVRFDPVLGAILG